MMMSTLSRRATLDRSMISNCHASWVWLFMQMVAAKQLSLLLSPGPTP